MTKIKILINIFLFLWINCLAISQTPQWRVAKGTENIAIDAMDICRSSPDTLYAFGDRQDTGMYPGMFLRSINRGETWDSIKIKASLVYSLVIDPKNSETFFISEEHPYSNLYDYVKKSYDSGEHWTTLIYGCCFRTPVIEIDPVNTQIVYIITGFGRLNRSTNGGQTWKYDSLGFDYPKSLSVSPANDSIIYLAGNVVLRSTDLGSTWEQLPFLSYPSVVRAHPQNPNIVYAAVSGIGMYKSTDRGFTWIEKTNGLNNKGIEIFVINPESPDEIYLGLSSGKSEDKLIYKTTDGGETWFEFSEGLPSPGHIGTIVIDTIHDRVHITVWAAQYGIYIHDYYTNVSENPRMIPKSYSLEQNYPNPFNPQTTIYYAIAEENRVKLTVMNILGQEVKLLVDEYQNAGFKSVTFNAGDLPSGIYFYRLQAGIFNSVNKMVLAR
jgi:photosystem II stability/assembly factor-like uncharacterized protein